MPVDRRVRRLAAACFALLPLASTGCGLAAAIAVPLITDVIEGDLHDVGTGEASRLRQQPVPLHNALRRRCSHRRDGPVRHGRVGVHDRGNGFLDVGILAV